MKDMFNEDSEKAFTINFAETQTAATLTDHLR